MATIVFVHAHPDDEASSTGGSIARAADEGHRVVLVVCTNGEHGTVPDDLAPGESLVERRRAETARSAEILGVHRIVWLDYSDSGMNGWPQNDAHSAFWAAPVEDAAARLVDLLADEDVDVLVTYDWHGGYGHPDHVQAHRVGVRAAELLGVARRFEVTFNRDAWRRQAKEYRSANPDAADLEDWDPDEMGDDGNPLGTPESELSLAVDVRAWVGRKQAALGAHASQTEDAGWMAAMEPEMFAAGFGIEWYIDPAAPPGLRTGWLLDPVLGPTGR
jgi:LmbE family N-acetylglucosaminyl deacetylase